MRKLPEKLKLWTEPERKMLIGYLWGSFLSLSKNDYQAAHSTVIATINEMFMSEVPKEYREEVEIIQRYVWGSYGREEKTTKKI